MLDTTAADTFERQVDQWVQAVITWQDRNDGASDCPVRPKGLTLKYARERFIIGRLLRNAGFTSENN